MGACSTFMTVNSTDRAVIKKEFDSYVAECVYEYGHSCYNGTFSTMEGLEISNKTFDNESVAEEYILDNTNKWENALAVTIKLEGKEPYTLIGGWAAC